jgi:hypothetical protein
MRHQRKGVLTEIKSFLQAITRKQALSHSRVFDEHLKHDKVHFMTRTNRRKGLPQRNLEGVLIVGARPDLDSVCFPYSFPVHQARTSPSHSILSSPLHLPIDNTHHFSCIAFTYARAPSLPRCFTAIAPRFSHSQCTFFTQLISRTREIACFELTPPFNIIKSNYALTYP